MRSPSTLSTVPTWTPSAPITSICSRIASLPAIVFLLFRSSRFAAFSESSAVPPDLKILCCLNRLEHRLFRCQSQIGVERRHHLRAIADRGGDALDRSGAHIADCEHAAPA